ncbi:hypothetical protein HanPI659440_Chr05g0184691 [Helianthus annuus]|nr:hypothetical protein HanPI659440_Chr05g0184691 [Helianthus annuus]
MWPLFHPLLHHNKLFQFLRPSMILRWSIKAVHIGWIRRSDLEQMHTEIRQKVDYMSNWRLMTRKAHDFVEDFERLKFGDNHSKFLPNLVFLGGYWRQFGASNYATSRKIDAVFNSSQH